MPAKSAKAKRTCKAKVVSIASAKPITTDTDRPMTLGDAKTITSRERLIFGNSRHIQALNLLQLAKRVDLLSTVKSYPKLCTTCNGTGRCSCFYCKAGKLAACERCGLCAGCGGAAGHELDIVGAGADDRTSEEFHEALDYIGYGAFGRGRDQLVKIAKEYSELVGQGGMR